MVIYLPKGALISIDGTELSDHNRSAAQLDFQIISFGDRIVDGTLKRRNLVKKRTLTLSWSELPALDSQTVDGKAGRNTIVELVSDDWSTLNTYRSVIYKEVDSSNVQTNVNINMMIESYNDELVRRQDKQLWNVNLSLIEV